MEESLKDFELEAWGEGELAYIKQLKAKDVAELFPQLGGLPEGIDLYAVVSVTAGMQLRLEGRESAPEALEWFPKENLASVRLIPESVLGLRLLKRGYVAKYAQGQAFVVLEATPESAAEVLKKLRERFDSTLFRRVHSGTYRC